MTREPSGQAAVRRRCVILGTCDGGRPAGARQDEAPRGGPSGGDGAGDMGRPIELAFLPRPAEESRARDAFSGNPS
jgi:hypothetical protein